MAAAQGGSERAEPVERFRPTSGRVVGHLGLALVGALLVYVALEARSLNGLRIAAGALFVAVLVWVTQLRPRATAYVERLHLQNVLRDVSVPMHLIDGVRVRRVLNVWAGGERYVCVGISAPLRTLVRSRLHGPASLIGWDRLEAYTEQVTPPRPDQTATSYPDYVEARIIGLAAEARSGAVGTAERVRTSWAVREVVALAVTALGLVATLLV